MKWFSRFEVLAKVLKSSSFMENHKLKYPPNEHISFKASLRNEMPLHSGGSRDIFILCLMRDKMYFWLFLIWKPMHSLTTLTYQLFGSKIKLRAIFLFLWPLFHVERKEFGSPCFHTQWKVLRLEIYLLKWRAGKEQGWSRQPGSYQRLLQRETYIPGMSWAAVRWNGCPHHLARAKALHGVKGALVTGTSTWALPGTGHYFTLLTRSGRQHVPGPTT